MYLEFDHCFVIACSSLICVLPASKLGGNFGTVVSLLLCIEMSFFSCTYIKGLFKQLFWRGLLIFICKILQHSCGRQPEDM